MMESLFQMAKSMSNELKQFYNNLYDAIHQELGTARQSAYQVVNFVLNANSPYYITTECCFRQLSNPLSWISKFERERKAFGGGVTPCLT